MESTTSYVSRQADASGRIAYTKEEDAVWAELLERQTRAIRGRACDEFVHGLDLLKFPQDRVPQLPEVSRVLMRETGWEVAPVPALIPFHDFCELLANKRFPAATFVRRRDELDYLKEPDIFHELFGHTPLLTNPYFAEFTHAYGKLGMKATREETIFLARLYWFTVEFGLIRRPGADLRIYGGGILSSIRETEYAAESPAPVRQRFDVIEALRTPYRIDILQPIYFVLEDVKELFDLARADLPALIAQACRMGLHPPRFTGHAEEEPGCRPHRKAA